MAHVLILGGGFGGVVAAEELAKKLGSEHQITLVSRNRDFLFYPALVRLAFCKFKPTDISFDLREALLDRGVQFLQAEVTRITPYDHRVHLAHGEVEGEMPYDYLICALGRRLATERIPGFFEHAHHLLKVDAALKFGEALSAFDKGEVVIGYCPGGRLAVPVYETAFALSRLLTERGRRDRVRITIMSPESSADQPGGQELTRALQPALESHKIGFLPDFQINRVTASSVWANDGLHLPFDLLMLVPPFQGASVIRDMGVTDTDGYIQVDNRMRVGGVSGLYAVGDCVSFPGPKMGHMAVRQGAVAAANVAAEIEGLVPQAEYKHEMRLIIDEGGSDSIFLHDDMSKDEAASVKQGRFWGWAKRVHEKYWQHEHA